MSREEYSERVGFQRWLDETFPAGATFTLMTRVEGRWSPSPPAVTGRLFCKAARHGDEGWSYQIFAEPAFDPEGAFGWQIEGDSGVFLPVEIWVPGLFSVEGVPGLFEGAVIGDSGEEKEDVTLRVSSVMEGPRALPERIRSEQTSRWESALFPDGLEVV